MSDKFQEAFATLIDTRATTDSELDMAHAGVVEAQYICHMLARNAGWWNGTITNETYATKLALIHSEVSEALEGLRKDKMDDHLPHRKAVEVELADAVIRIMDMAGALGLDLSGAMVEKLAYNQQRADHKQENRNADGGKKF